MKTCKTCKQEKTVDSFYKSFAHCKACMAVKNAAYHKENREKNLLSMREYHQKNRDRLAEKAKVYHQENREQRVQKNAAYRKTHEDKTAIARNAKRRAMKARAIPAWDDAIKTREIYSLSKAWNEIWPSDKVHVDHIVPLTSKIVCGLHTSDNLRIIRAIENRQKLNSFWPDMPSKIVETQRI